MRRRDFIILLASAMGGWPSALRAQQNAMPVIGFIGGASPGTGAFFVNAFLQGLRETGYTEGQNVAIEYRWTGGDYARLPELAADLVARKVDVIAAADFPAAVAAKTATGTIPIIFEVGVDPVERGLVASFARPSGNLTGITSLSIEVTPKRVELITELVPQAKVIALLVNPSNPTTERVIRDVQKATSIKKLQLQILRASAESEIEAAFASIVELHAGALVVESDPFFNTHREPIIRPATSHALPTIYGWREFVADGGLISYGPSLPAAFRQVGNYVGRILNGGKPADLPVHQSAIFELVLNLKTARILGLTIPPLILARADEVIE